MEKRALVFLGWSGGGPSFAYSILKEGFSGKPFDGFFCSKKNELITLYKDDFKERVNAYSLPHRVGDFLRLQILIDLYYMVKRLKGFDEVLITAYHPFLLLMIPYLSRYTSLRYVMHDVKPHSFSLAQRVLNWLAASTCTEVLVLSSTQREYYLKLYRGLLYAPVVQIRHPVYHHYLSPNFSPVTRGIEFVPFLFFGRLEIYKGLEMLLKLGGTTGHPLIRIAGKGKVPPEFYNHPEFVIDNRYVLDGEVPELFNQCSCVLLPYHEATQSGLFELAATFEKKIIATPLDVFFEQSRQVDVEVFFMEEISSVSLEKIIFEIK